MGDKTGGFTREQLADLALDYQGIAARQGSAVMRYRMALEILREFGGIGGNWNASVTAVVRRWIDGGMDSPLPWPGGAFFEEWAAKKGLSNIDGFCGYRLKMQIVQDTHHAD